MPFSSQRYLRASTVSAKGSCMYQPSSMTEYCQPYWRMPASTVVFARIVGFVDGEAVGVPTVPAHGRSGRRGLGEHGWETE